MSEKLDLLPPNATPLEKAVSKSDARILDTDTNIVRRSRLSTSVQAAFLPALAWERSVHHWSGTDDAADRAATGSSFRDHGRYGRPDTLEAELSADNGIEVTIVEAADDPRLEWPDFVVEAVIDPGDPIPDFATLLSWALRRKNVRDMPSVRLRGRMPVSTLYAGAAASVTPMVRILPEDALPPLPTLFAGAAARTLPLVRILPR